MIILVMMILFVHCEKFWKQWEYQTTWPASRETCMQVRKQQLQTYCGTNTKNKTSGGDGIPAELFQNPERWCCESAALNMPANLENLAVATGLEKLSFQS